MIGQKIAIVSDKAQTTRNKITGVLTRDHYQIIFLDTPGILPARNKLGEYMCKTAFEAMRDIEAILFVTDALCGLGARDDAILKRLTNAVSPVIALINKCDAAPVERIRQMELSLEKCKLFHSILSISAKTGENLSELESLLSQLLVEGPQFFPKDMVTDQPERMLCCEFIREKALQLLREEVPHGIGVSIEKMENRQDRDLMDIYATIYCERASHKGIILGRSGQMLKKIGISSRADIEWLLGTPVNLQLWVKVAEDWRNRNFLLRELGYA